MRFHWVKDAGGGQPVSKSTYEIKTGTVII